MHLISRLRDDSVLRYKYFGEKTGKKALPESLLATWIEKILKKIIS